MDLEACFFNWTPGTYNFSSRGCFQIIFIESTKKFSQSTFKKLNGSIYKLIQHYKYFYFLLYANIGEKVPFETFCEYDLFHVNQMNYSFLKFNI